MKKAAAQGAKSQIKKPRHANGRKQDVVDPEGCYRRGFEHGAYLTFESAKHLFDSEAGRERLRQWVEVELRQWRLAARGRDEASPPRPPER